MGLDPNLDVDLRYYIVDKKTGQEVDVGAGESGYKKITGMTNIDQTFFTSNLEPGTYELWLELNYCTNWDSASGKCLTSYERATAHSEFLVYKEGADLPTSEAEGLLSALAGYKIPLLILGIAIVVLIILIIIIMFKSPKRRKGKR